MRGYQNPENVRKRIFDMVRGNQNPETHIQVRSVVYFDQWTGDLHAIRWLKCKALSGVFNLQDRS